MPRNSEAIRQRTIRKHEMIRNEYHKLREVKKNGVRLYSDEYIMNELELKFCLSKRTIDDIITFRYERIIDAKTIQQSGDPNQLSILDQIPDAND